MRPHFCSMLGAACAPFPLTYQLLTTTTYRLEGSFDLAVALSAFDHDGLGRYGDADLLPLR